MTSSRGSLLRRLAFAGLAILTVVIGVVVWRMFLGPKAPERDYRQELIDLSRSIVPETPEARANTDIMVRVLEELTRISEEERNNMPQSERDLISGLASDFDILKLQHLPDAAQLYGLPDNYGPTLKHAQRVHARYITEIVPLLDGIDSAHQFSPTWELSAPGELLVATQSPFFSESLCLQQLEQYSLLQALSRSDEQSALHSLDRLALIGVWQISEPTLTNRLRLLGVQSSIAHLLSQSVRRDEMTGESAREIHSRFRQIMGRAPRTSDQIEMERLVCLSFIEGIHSNDPNMDMLWEFEKVTPWPLVNLMNTERASVDAVNDLFDRLRVIEDGRATETFDDVINETQRPGSPLLVIGEPIRALVKMLEMYREQSWRSEVALTILALEAYRGEHGAYPESLDTLVPAYIDRVPVDWLDPDGNSLRYRVLPEGHVEPVEHGYLLWSIGPDGVDDAGVLDPAALLQVIPKWFRGSPWDLIYLVDKHGVSWEGDIPLNASDERISGRLGLSSGISP